jgi:hypothetical protein
MKVLKSVFAELWGLFVDDGTLAIGLLAWCVFARLVLPATPLSLSADAVLLFVGCLTVLLASVALPAFTGLGSVRAVSPANASRTRGFERGGESTLP